VQRADRITRAVAAFVDILVILGLHRLPDVLGVLSAAGYILIRDGLFGGCSIGKKVIKIRVAVVDEQPAPATYRESIIRNTTVALAYLLFLIPYAGWALCLLVIGVECLAAIGDEQGMRIGDLLARTRVVTGAAAAEQQPSDDATAGTEQEMRLP
jgi:uncharacterized RDD family membrane protein YckC